MNRDNKERSFVNILSKVRNPTGRNKVEGIPGIIITLIAISWSVFHLYTGYLPLMAMYQRIIFVGFAMVLIFLIFPIWGREQPKKLTIHGLALAALAVGILAYLWINYTARALTIGMITYTTDLVLGAIFIVLVLDICRRTTGWPFTIVSVVLLIYARYGEMMPSVFAHKDYDVDRIISGVFLTTEGIFGSITGITATFIYIFVLFGAFLRHSGAGDFFLDFSNALLGKRRGGAAKIAVFGSSFFGMISGSALANVAGTGQFTIPLMKKTGYRPYFAGAVESVASSGGQMLPPIMGGSAFIMMELLGVSYLAVCKAALLIGILYYVAAFIMVDIEAAKTGLKGLAPEEVPSVWKTLLGGWHYVVPIVILVYCLVTGMSATRAAFWGTIAIPAVSMFRKKGRMTLQQIFWALEDAAYTACSIAGIVIAMGIVVGMITLTGLGLTLSSILLELAGGNLITLLILAMLASIVLGMGVPIICAYIVLSVLVCPAIIELGVEPIAAHLFVFYFAILSAITPPVAPAAFIAAGIADAPMMKTAITACKIGLGLIVLPYFMIFDQGILMMGSWFDILRAVLRALVSICALVAVVEGFFFSAIGLINRVVLLVAAILLIHPALYTTLAGYVLVIITVLSSWLYTKMSHSKVQTPG